MTGRPARETVMSSLFTVLTGALKTTFTADTQANSAALTNPSTTAGLFVGMPVFGPGIERGSVLQSLSPLTLSLPAKTGGSALALTTGFLTSGRRLIHWSQVSEQPALFLRDGDHERLEFGGNTINQKLTLLAEVWIYSNAGQNNQLAPAIAMNYLLDAVQSAFAPDDYSQGRFTLGGLVEWCRIAPKIDKVPGDLDGQAVAVMDVEITVP